jgi:hypothetical protein
MDIALLAPGSGKSGHVELTDLEPCPRFTGVPFHDLDTQRRLFDSLVSVL